MPNDFTRSLRIKSKPSSFICVIVVFSCESSSPRSFRNFSITGLTVFTRTSYNYLYIASSSNNNLSYGDITSLCKKVTI